MRGLELVMCLEDISTNHESVNELISNGVDCRTDPATPGL